MKWITFIAAILFAGSLMGQSDTLIRLNGSKIVITVKQTTSNSIIYTIASQPNTLVTVPTSEVEWIIYKSGRRVMYNKPVLQVADNGEWQKIVVTRDAKQISNMYKLGSVSGRSANNQLSKTKAYNSAVEALQREAAKLKGSVVLITAENYPGGYNDPPSCKLEGTVWSLQATKK